MDAPQDNKGSDPLALPAPDVLAEIARKQDARAAEIRAARAVRRHSKEDGSMSEEQSRTNAAMLIQKNYRGHRTRRAMQGRGLDPSVRWIEALKEGGLDALQTAQEDGTDTKDSEIHQRHSAEVARHIKSKCINPGARALEACYCYCA